MKIIRNTIILLLSLLLLLLFTSCNNSNESSDNSLKLKYTSKIKVKYNDNTIDTIYHIFYPTNTRKLPQYKIYVRNNIGLLIIYTELYNYDIIAVDIKQYNILDQQKHLITESIIQK
jgi:hypothetical protein